MSSPRPAAPQRGCADLLASRAANATARPPDGSQRPILLDDNVCGQVAPARSLARYEEDSRSRRFIHATEGGSFSRIVQSIPPRCARFSVFRRTSRSSLLSVSGARAALRTSPISNELADSRWAHARSRSWARHRTSANRSSPQRSVACSRMRARPLRAETGARVGTRNSAGRAVK